MIARTLIAVAAVVAASQAKTWDFQKDEPGKIANGFKAEVGAWAVAKDGDNLVLEQTAKNANAVYNIAFVEETSHKDLDLTVKLRAIEGIIDQGGGLVWRAKDAKNYYIARFNPMEENFRVYKVENGKRTQLGDAKAPDDDKWHTLRVTMTGTKIACYLDGKKSLEADDATFPDAGKIGLWSKADAQTQFDDLTIEAR